MNELSPKKKFENLMFSALHGNIIEPLILLCFNGSLLFGLQHDSINFIHYKWTILCDYKIVHRILFVIKIIHHVICNNKFVIFRQKSDLIQKKTTSINCKMIEENIIQKKKN